MKETPYRHWQTTIVAIILISTLAVVSHMSLVSVGMNLTDSEWATFLVWADAFRHGQFYPFPYQQNYGGAALPVLRAAWGILWRCFDHSNRAIELSHMTFSYAVCPALMALASYFLLKRYTSRVAATVMGLVCAVGFQFWIFQYGNDLYPAFYIMGCLLLGWRARWRSPFWELPLEMLALAGFASGFALYTMPASQIYVFAFLVPWSFIQTELRSNLRWQTGADSKFFEILHKLGLIVVGLGLYLEVFGRDLGPIWAGKSLKLDPAPNYYLGGAMLALCSFIRWWKRQDRQTAWTQQGPVFAFLKRAFIFGLFLLLGDLPEILFLRQHHVWFPEREWVAYDFPVSVRILGLVPESLRALVSGAVGFRPIDFTARSAAEVFSVGLVLAGIGALISEARKNYRIGFDALFLTVGISVFSYCRVFTKVPEFAPPRYLFPLFPVLIVGCGIFMNKILENRKLWPIGLILISGHCTHQLVARHKLVEAAQKSERHGVNEMIVNEFQKAEVKVVVSDDFWYSNTLTAISEENPWFWSSWRNWGPFEAKGLALSEPRVGILVKAGGSEESTKRAEMLGRVFDLTPLGHAGDRALFVGQARKN